MKGTVFHRADRRSRPEPGFEGIGPRAWRIGGLLASVVASSSVAQVPSSYRLDAMSTGEHGQSLDVLELVAPSVSTPARLGTFGRMERSLEPTQGTIGMGGVDLSWRPDDRLSIAMVAGGAMDALDRNRIDLSLVAPEPWPGDPVSSMGGRTSAFDGLDFGGFNAGAISPFDSGRVMAAPIAGDRLRSTFLATRAVVKPLDGTRVGFVATHGGVTGVERSVVGMDLGQQIGGHRVDVWFQQSLGASDLESSGRDRLALGASICGSLDALRYAVGWSQVGMDFESGLGRSGSGSTNSFAGRFDWSLPLGGLAFLDRVEFGVAAAVDADEEFDPNLVDIKVDAVRLVTTKGHRVELGMVQELRAEEIGPREFNSVERYRVAVVSDPSAALKIRGQVDLGDSQDQASCAWNGSARWTPGGGVHIGGSVRAEARTDDREFKDTLLTSLDGGFDIGDDAVFRTRVGLDAGRDRLTMGHSLGWELEANASLSISLEQELPMMSSPDESMLVRARIGGKFDF